MMYFSGRGLWPASTTLVTASQWMRTVEGESRRSVALQLGIFFRYIVIVFLVVFYFSCLHQIKKLLFWGFWKWKWHKDSWQYISELGLLLSSDETNLHKKMSKQRLNDLEMELGDKSNFWQWRWSDECPLRKHRGGCQVSHFAIPFISRSVYAPREYHSLYLSQNDCLRRCGGAFVLSVSLRSSFLTLLNIVSSKRYYTTHIISTPREVVPPGVGMRSCQGVCPTKVFTPRRCLWVLIGWGRPLFFPINHYWEVAMWYSRTEIVPPNVSRKFFK